MAHASHVLAILAHLSHNTGATSARLLCDSTERDGCDVTIDIARHLQDGDTGHYVMKQTPLRS